MIEIKGRFNTAIVYTDELEDKARDQIRQVCDTEAFKDNKIRIMPDVHAGMGCTIGTTMTITDKIVPGMVGVDIGCGMETVKIAEREMDFRHLDRIIRKNIPSGRDIRKKAHRYADEIDLSELRCAEHVNLERARKSIGTLGGGNHFIEVDENDEGEKFIVVHSGSRHLGVEVADYYQKQGYLALMGAADHQIKELIETLKAEGRYREIEKEIKKAKAGLDIGIPKDLAYVEGKLFEDYIHDMKIVQRFATLNRKAMIDTLFVGMRLTRIDEFTTIHNYIDTESMILRKGSVSAKRGEKILIPMNMRDGSLICIGKGNEDWNCSAPHGAGRLMSRKRAFDSLSMDDYTRQMDGIFTTSVSRKTLDEAPMAYKSMQSIIDNIGPTAEIVEIIKPVYNFKARE